VAGKQLTKETIDQVIFGMENQDDDFYLDLDRMIVMPSVEIKDIEALGSEDTPRYVEVPPWQSVDGFNLMERFVGQLHNPLVRVELQRILVSGRGVFRQFKDVLRQYPEVAKRWYRFKDQSMQRVVVDWFVATMDTYGISYDNPDFEEIDDLVLDNFAIFSGSIAQIQERLGQKGLYELILGWDSVMAKELYPDGQRDLWIDRRNRLAPGSGIDDYGAYATAPDGSGAGFLRIARDEAGRGVVNLLYVEPEYRGLGIARVLIDKVLESWPGKKDDLQWWIPAAVPFLGELLRERGYQISHSLFSVSKNP